MANRGRQKLEIEIGKIAYGPLNANGGNAFYFHHKPKDMVRILSKLVVKEVEKTMLGAPTPN